MHAKFSRPQKPRIFEGALHKVIYGSGGSRVLDLVLPSWVWGLLRTGRIVMAQLAPLASLQPLCCSVS